MCYMVLYMYPCTCNHCCVHTSLEEHPGTFKEDAETPTALPGRVQREYRLLALFRHLEIYHDISGLTDSHPPSHVFLRYIP